MNYTDNCNSPGIVIGTETGPSGDPLTIIRTWTLTDDCGNSVPVTQTITITEMIGIGNENYNGCIGDGYSIIVNGTTYDESNPTGTEDFQDANGCDTTVIINLVFNYIWKA